jgi:hypothetical protein
VRGTVFEVQVDQSQETLVWVETGSVGVRHRLLPGREISVQSGQSIRVVPTLPLAEAKPGVPVRTLGRVIRAIGETLAQVNATRGSGSSGSGGGSGSPTGTSGGSSGSGDAGSNEPAPPPDQDDNSGSGAPPGDVVQ